MKVTQSEIDAISITQRVCANGFICDDDRAALALKAPDVFEVRECIQNFDKCFLYKNGRWADHYPEQISSYYGKHVIEKSINSYISNGAFIIGAMLSCFLAKRARANNPNALIYPNKRNYFYRLQKRAKE